MDDSVMRHVRALVRQWEDSVVGEMFDASRVNLSCGEHKAVDGVMNFDEMLLNAETPEELSEGMDRLYRHGVVSFTACTGGSGKKCKKEPRDEAKMKELREYYERDLKDVQESVECYQSTMILYMKRFIDHYEKATELKCKLNQLGNEDQSK